MFDWGADLMYRWVLPGPVDNPRGRIVPVGKHAEADSGARDFWETRPDDALFYMTVRLIPRATQGDVTGYYAPVNGVQLALAWMFKNRSRLFLDRTQPANRMVYVVNEPEAVPDGAGPFVRVDLVLRDVNGTPFTEI
jgi:hypothetical protein